jgi:hypothetical protein
VVLTALDEFASEFTEHGLLDVFAVRFRSTQARDPKAPESQVWSAGRARCWRHVRLRYRRTNDTWLREQVDLRDRVLAASRRAARRRTALAAAALIAVVGAAVTAAIRSRTIRVGGCR